MIKRHTEKDGFGNYDISGVSGSLLQGHLHFKEMNRVTNALNKLGHVEELEEKSGLTYIEAFDKLMPKKPLYRDEYWLCPNCNEFVFLGDKNDTFMRPNHCLICGQALNWQDDIDE